MRLDQTVMQLQAEGRVDFKKLISHRFAARDLQQAYDLLSENPQLQRLKELESLEKILAGTSATFVLGQGDLSDQIRSLVSAKA